MTYAGEDTVEPVEDMLLDDHCRLQSVGGIEGLASPMHSSSMSSSEIWWCRIVELRELHRFSLGDINPDAAPALAGRQRQRQLELESPLALRALNRQLQRSTAQPAGQGWHVRPLWNRARIPGRAREVSCLVLFLDCSGSQTIKPRHLPLSTTVRLCIIVPRFAPLDLAR